MRREGKLNRQNWGSFLKEHGCDNKSLAANEDEGTGGDWKNERKLYLETLKAISRDLEEQKKINSDLQLKLAILEGRKSMKDKLSIRKASGEQSKPQHHKTNSDAHNNQDAHKLNGKLIEKSKDDYAAKRAQYKLIRMQKGKNSLPNKGFGSDIIAHRSSGEVPIFPQKVLLGSANSNESKGPTFGEKATKEAGSSDLGFAKEVFAIRCNSGDITALYMKESDSVSDASFLAEASLPQQVPHFMHPDRKSLITEGGVAKLVKPGKDATSFRSTLPVEANLKSAESHNQLFHEKCTLKSHMDTVRDAQFVCNLNYLVTVSEDCMVKLWDIKGLKNNALPHSTRIEPCFTYRGHTGPLFTVCVGSHLQSHEHFLYSAGSEGVIRIWAIPSNRDKYPLTNGKNHCVGLWTSHRDVVWQLVHHPTDDLLLSVSADGTVKMWKEFDISELVDGVENNSNDCLLGAFVHRSHNKQFYEMPTSAAWVSSSSGSLLIAYINSFLGLFDQTTGRNKAVFRFETNSGVSPFEQQVNKVVSSPGSSLAFTAHENGYVRVFDLNSQKQLKGFVAHSEPVTAIASLNGGMDLLTGSSKGVIKQWDMRKCQCIGEMQVHCSKYGEGVCSLAIHERMPFIATAGADATAKVHIISL